MNNASNALTAFLLAVSTSMGFAADEIGPSRTTDLLPPVRMTAAGKPIVAAGRCAGLTMGDFDNDGKMDLLVGQMIGGRLRIYLNIGTVARPKFGEATDLIAGDEQACIPSGCYTAFNPQLVDFDGDGRIDILSPSFSSGIYLFRRSEDRKFAEAELVENRDGQPIQFRYNGAALAYDWDADGDLDLIVRGLAGAQNGVNLIVNEGHRQNPVYESIQLLLADGEALLGKPCCVIDWDDDGKDDLLTCAGDVYWYRNIGEKDKPVLQAAEILVPSGRYQQYERRQEMLQQLPDEPGRIDSICAADVNGDGRPDLLAASTWSEKVELPEPTDRQRAAMKDRKARIFSLNTKSRELRRQPKQESREERIRRQRDLLQAWEEREVIRTALAEFESRHNYSCLWLFERSAESNLP